LLSPSLSQLRDSSDLERRAPKQLGDDLLHTPSPHQQEIAQGSPWRNIKGIFPTIAGTLGTADERHEA